MDQSSESLKEQRGEVNFRQIFYLNGERCSEFYVEKSKNNYEGLPKRVRR